ncbi:MAG: NAD(P)-dependent oxidoreductase [Pseudomonadales bacterium]|nr:NAD(P)-dependent oxidoreductase [Pseudomonadales bacterium]
MNKYLITGGSGFIGTNLVEELLARGDIILSVDVVSPKNSAHLPYFQQASLLDENKLTQIVKDFAPTHIYHLGARTDLNGKTLEDYQENIVGVENLIAAANAAGSVQRVVFASSRLVCKIGYQPKNYTDYCPTTPYGESKVVGENIVNSLSDVKWSWCIFRPTSIWGPWFDVPYRNFFDTVRKGVYLHPTNATILKSFGYVGNSVYQIRKLMDVESNKIHKKTFYIGDYQPIDVLEFANSISEEFQVSKPKSVPLWLLKIAAIVGDSLNGIGIGFPLTTFRLNNLITPMLHDFSDLQEVVGDLPYSMKDGVKLTVTWMNKHE